jgi:hypothetical protein
MLHILRIFEQAKVDTNREQNTLQINQDEMDVKAVLYGKNNNPFTPFSLSFHPPVSDKSSLSTHRTNQQSTTIANHRHMSQAESQFVKSKNNKI